MRACDVWIEVKPSQQCLRLLEAYAAKRSYLFYSHSFLVFHDATSKALQWSPVSKARFDSDRIDYESASLRAKSEGSIAHYYLGARSADAYEELENPTPRS